MEYLYNILSSIGFVGLDFLMGHTVNSSTSTHATWRQNMFGWVDTFLSFLLDTDTVTQCFQLGLRGKLRAFSRIW